MFLRNLVLIALLFPFTCCSILPISADTPKDVLENNLTLLQRSVTNMTASLKAANEKAVHYGHLDADLACFIFKIRQMEASREFWEFLEQFINDKENDMLKDEAKFEEYLNNLHEFFTLDPDNFSAAEVELKVIRAKMAAQAVERKLYLLLSLRYLTCQLEIARIHVLLQNGKEASDNLVKAFVRIWCDTYSQLIRMSPPAALQEWLKNTYPDISKKAKAYSATGGVGLIEDLIRLNQDFMALVCRF